MPDFARDPAAVPAVILCGGLGTRMRDATEFIPKPMVRIGTQPIVWHIMKHYSKYGIRDFIICLGYKGEALRDYFINYNTHTRDIRVDLATGSVQFCGGGDDQSVLDWRVTLADTGIDSPTGQRVVKVLPHLPATFFLTYGDGVANVDISDLLAQHRRSGRQATVTAVRPLSRFGEMALDADKVTSFREKPQIGEGWINGGFLVFEKSAFANYAPSQPLILETDVMTRLASNNDLTVYRHEGFWQCMDTFRELTLLNDLWNRGEAPWKTW